MTEITIELDGQLKEWALKQTNIVEAIKHALKEHIERMQTPFDIAISQFRQNLLAVPEGFEFEVPQIVGTKYWEQLDRGSRLAFGKHIKANQEAFSVAFLRTTQSRHAVYKKANSHLKETRK
jgi:hypothetical protein